MSDEFRFAVDLPPAGRVTGRLLCRDLSDEEDREYRAAIMKAYRLKRNVTRVREKYFDLVVIGAERLARHGRIINVEDPNWKALIPPGVKDDLMIQRFEGTLQNSSADEEDEDNEKNSDGSSGS